MRKFKTLLTCIVLVIFNSTDIYSQNTDNTFGIFESLEGYKFENNPFSHSENYLEFKLIDNGETLVLDSYARHYNTISNIFIKKTEVPNQFLVQGTIDGDQIIKKSTAHISEMGALQLQISVGNSELLFNYELKSAGISVTSHYLLENGKWSEANSRYFYFPDQADPSVPFKKYIEFGFPIEFGDMYSNDPNELKRFNNTVGTQQGVYNSFIEYWKFREFYRTVLLKNSTLKINVKTTGKTIITLYNSMGNSIKSVESNANAILKFPIPKDDLYFVSILQEDDSKKIVIQFILE